MPVFPSRRARTWGLIFPFFLILFCRGLPAQESLAWSGRFRLGLSYFLDGDGAEGPGIAAWPELRLGLLHQGPSSELSLALRLDPGLSSAAFGDLVEQAAIAFHYDKLTLEAGFLKVEWGSGDRLHVLDLINPFDRSRCILPEYAERKQAQAMVRAGFSAGTSGLLELVYVPVFTPDLLPMEGRWVPPELREAAAGGGAAPAPGPEPTLGTLQAGVRYTDRVGEIGFGGLFYYGYLREPALIDGLPFLSYDRVLAFGVEGRAPLAGSTVRWEAGYLKTPDGSGTDPRVRNSRVSALAGFERTFSLRRIEVDRGLELSLQLAGTLLVGGGRLAPGDVDLPPEGSPHRLALVARMGSTRPRDPFHPEVLAVYHPLGGDFLLQPSLTVSPGDDVQVSVRAAVFSGGAHTPFGRFAANDLVELAFTYRF